jgi:predicted kinase
VSEARLILTCGLPGAGKTALARQLGADRSAVRLSKDEWLTALGSSPWDTPTREKVEHELWRLAQEILRLGLSVVLDFGLWARIERDEMRSAARGLGVGVELHYLDVPTDVLWRRIQARNSQSPWDSYPIRRADLDGWLLLFQAPDAAEMALFDPPPDSNRDTTDDMARADPCGSCSLVGCGSALDRVTHPRHSCMLTQGGGGRMPKKYRVELSIVDDANNTQLENDTHTETYKDEAQAREKFQDKVKVVRETGKGSGQG